jgi:S1-C subfamily serine protease
LKPIRYALFLLSLGGSLPGPAAGQAGTQGQLSLRIVIIDELTPKPLIYTDLAVTGGPGLTKQVVRTDEQGELKLNLAPGKYVLDTVKPVTFKGAEFSWHREFAIQAGEETVLKLTDADATRSNAKAVADEAVVYQKYKGGVVEVQSDSGHGSGFLVDASGIIVTNQHVVNGSRWLGARLRPGLRCEATLLAEDKESDVAVIQINPKFAKDMTVLSLADASKPPVAVEGERILAIGNPLHQEGILTTGIVSKVEKGVLMSNVNINHGNSGGPVLNLEGQVVGIATFSDIDRQGGPGVAGIVSIEKAAPVLAQARSSGKPAPSDESLPDVNPIPIPASLLSAVTERDVKSFSKTDARYLALSIDTPFMAAAREAEATARARAKMHDRGDDSTQAAANAFWRRYSNPNDAVVVVRLDPKVRKAGLFYKEEFYDMQVVRGGQLVQPVRRDRVLWNLRNLRNQIVDRAYGAAYQYDYTVFEPSEPLVVKIRESAASDQWEEVKIEPKVQANVWSQFAGYRSALSSSR